MSYPRVMSVPRVRRCLAYPCAYCKELSSAMDLFLLLYEPTNHLWGTISRRVHEFVIMLLGCGVDHGYLATIKTCHHIQYW